MAPHEPLEEVLKHYTDTLCSVQKQTLQHHCYRIFRYLLGNDATLLEDWLTDIGTVTDITLESRTKLSQAKSKGLTCTLITEAITSRKSWDEIKDLL